MADLAVEGPDALKLLSHLGVNSFDGFVTDQAKHFVPCSPDGYVIGDVILFELAENTLQPRRPRARAELDHASTRRPAATTSRSRSTSARRCAPTGSRKSYRYQVQGPNAMQVIEKVLGHGAPELKLLPHDDGDDRGPERARASPRHGGPARLGAVRPVGRPRAGARGDRDGRRGVRAPAGRRSRLLVEHARVGLDPLAAAGRLLGREPQGLPRVAAGERLRGLGLDRRQLRLARRSRTTTSRPGTSATATTSSSTTTSSGATRSSEWPTASTGRRSRSPSTTTTSRARSARMLRQVRAREVHRLAVGGLLHAPVRPRHRRRRDRRGLDLGRLQRQRGQDAHARRRSTRSTQSPGPR